MQSQTFKESWDCIFYASSYWRIESDILLIFPFFHEVRLTIKSTKKQRMANKKKIAIAVGIGAVVGIGMTILAGLGLGKKQGGAYLGKCHCKK